MRSATSATALALAIALALGASSCGGGAASTSTTAASTTTRAGAGHRGADETARRGPDRRPPAAHHQSNRAAVREAVAQGRQARLDALQRQVATAVRGYVAALDSRDGARVCKAFAPGALDVVHFPRRRGSCPASVEASIGYRDPRGFPVYEHSRIARIRSVAIKGADARAVATVVTRFAGDREPSIEDDVVYLRRHGGSWLVVKPSSAVYRAIGVGDIPPSVLAPPAG